MSRYASMTQIGVVYYSDREQAETEARERQEQGQSVVVEPLVGWTRWARRGFHYAVKPEGVIIDNPPATCMVDR